MYAYMSLLPQCSDLAINGNSNGYSSLEEPDGLMKHCLSMYVSIKFGLFKTIYPNVVMKYFVCQCGLFLMDWWARQVGEGTVVLFDFEKLQHKSC